jgi:hypothetical protein
MRTSKKKSNHTIFLFDRGLPLVVACLRWHYLSGSNKESETEGGHMKFKMGFLGSQWNTPRFVWERINSG